MEVSVFCSYYEDINLFYATGYFLYLLKTSEKLSVLFLEGIESNRWHEIG